VKGLWWGGDSFSGKKDVSIVQGIKVVITRRVSGRKEKMTEKGYVRTRFPYSQRRWKGKEEFFVENLSLKDYPKKQMEKTRRLLRSRVGGEGNRGKN